MEEKTYKQSGKTLTSEFQKAVYETVAARHGYGVTDIELQRITGKGHGSTSSALSTLHKNGYIERLKDKRDQNTVYVLPQYVEGRETLPPMTNTGEKSEVKELRKKLKKVEELVKPGWRSYSYTRDDLMDDIRRALL